MTETNLSLSLCCYIALWFLAHYWKTKLVQIGNTEAQWWLLRNQWRHSQATIVLFTYVRHFSRGWNVFVLVEMNVFLDFILLGRGRIFFRILKFYSAYQCVPRRHKSKHWSKWASFEESWYVLEYKAPLISVGINFVQPSRNCKQFQLEQSDQITSTRPYCWLQTIDIPTWICWWNSCA